MSDSPELAIEIDHLTKRYDAAHGIYDISLQVNKGAIFGFLGPNGAGKSTTINTILDVLRAEQGTIRILGLDHIKDSKEVHRHIGYMAADMETDPALTGRQYLSFVAALHNHNNKRMESLVVRLKADLTTRIKHLSRGNRQKIGLIAALMHAPDILILDEPTSGLDPLVQAEFYAILREHQQEGKTTFMSSHILSEVQAICDHVGFIREGKLIHVSPLDALLEQASRQVTITFATLPPESTFKTLDGVDNFSITHSTVHFSFKGDLNNLTKLLAKHAITHLEVSEANLEALFMSYYSKEEIRA